MSQNQFKKIIVPLDGSSNSIRGLNEAIALAIKTGGNITGLNVISSASFANAPQILKKYRKEMLKNSEKIISQAKTYASRNGIEFNGKIITSPGIAKTITGYAKSKGFDILIMGSRGKSAPDAIYLGSVTNGVLHNSKIPVLVVK